VVKAAELEWEHGLPAVPGSIERWPNGALRRLVLAEDSELHGWPCAAGTQVRFRRGHPAEATLVAPLVLPELTLPPDTKISFHGGSLCAAILPSAVSIAGLLWPAETELELEGGRLLGAVSGGKLEVPSGYRAPPRLAAGARVAWGGEGWDLARVEPPSPPASVERAAGPPRRPMISEGDRLVGWLTLAAILAAPLLALAALAWARSGGVGARCDEHSECHDLLGHRCLAGVCSPPCAEDAHCPAGWWCAEAFEHSRQSMGGLCQSARPVLPLGARVEDGAAAESEPPAPARDRQGSSIEDELRGESRAR
jgi:hypothetical protein